MRLLVAVRVVVVKAFSVRVKLPPPAVFAESVFVRVDDSVVVSVVVWLPRARRLCWG
jgi:hypothetical protein